jgi:Domain of unknown function (DUF4406)
MRLYIAGPMRGLPNENHEAFDATSAALRAQGHEIRSPTEIGRQAIKTGGGIREIFALNLMAVCDCEGLLLLPGWENSRGALAEKAVADALDIRVYLPGENIE